ncbi:glycosyltransferase family A protein [Clostridium sp. OS1-26]|uniref:glycosyltransferase family A protein n=1 Tax=Clostridium sp. OS1-26 TaxID=3070681 RepID=UPI0027E0490B|nr:glycosyltransferase family A protein [Clostridium sp. OS1-26]WML35843.1 glycosyltransferase family A protein [Clostridium sp. OS1-26]
MLKQFAKERVLVKRIREKCSKTSQPGVSIIVPTNKSKYINSIFKNYNRLIYPYKELIIILNNDKLNIKDYKMKAEGLKDVRIFQLGENYTLGECLNLGIEQSKYDYISKIDDDDYYGAYYLIDLMNVFKYTDAQITGKATCFIYFQNNNNLGIFLPNYENRYVNHLAGGTILFKKEVFKKVKFRSLNIGEDNYFLNDCSSAGLKIFSSDKYNYVYMRNKNLHEHTWQISQKELLTSCIINIPFKIKLTNLITI